MILKKIILKGLQSGLPLIPTNANKQPIVKSWKDGVDVKEVKKLSSVDGIAIATGGDLELIDFDLKYDLNSDLYENYKQEVILYSQELFDSMVVQTTVSGGFHWFYKCKGLEDGNLKLARREATEEEQEKGEKVKVLLETRGVGGYVMIEPTPDYKFIQGDLKSLSYISKLDRDFLMSLARSYNTYRDNRKEIVISDVTIKTAFDDYDERTTAEETINLLKSHGWTEASRVGDRVAMLRAGDTKSKHSGYYELDKDRFSVFSTSTEFEPETRYKKSAVYCVLEHDGDFTRGAKKLYEDGFGVTAQVKIDSSGEVIPESEISKYLMSYDKIWEKIEDFQEGRIEVGLGTSMEALDNWFRFRKNALVTFLAKMNVGKTTIVQWLQVLGSKVHGLKWVILSVENSEDDYVSELLSFYLSDDPVKVKKQNPKKYKDAQNFIEEHFFFLDNVEDIETALSVTKVLKSLFDVFAIFIDPINSVKPSKKVANWDYSIATSSKREMLKFRLRVCSVWISMHPNIGTQRVDGIPKSVDAEFGVLANGADISNVFDRDKGSINGNVTEWKIDKVRSKRLGGQITDSNNPIQLFYKTHFFDVKVPRQTSEGQIVNVMYYNPMKGVKEDEYKEPPLPLVEPSDAFVSADGEKSDSDKFADDEVPF